MLKHTHAAIVLGATAFLLFAPALVVAELGDEINVGMAHDHPLLAPDEDFWGEEVIEGMVNSGASYSPYGGAGNQVPPEQAADIRRALGLAMAPHKARDICCAALLASGEGVCNVQQNDECRIDRSASQGTFTGSR
jgi:hypothetical protein